MHCRPVSKSFSATFCEHGLQQRGVAARLRAFGQRLLLLSLVVAAGGEIEGGSLRCPGAAPTAMPFLWRDPVSWRFDFSICGLGPETANARWDGVLLVVWSNGEVVSGDQLTWEEMESLQDANCCFNWTVSPKMFKEGKSNVRALACDPAKRCAGEGVVLSQREIWLMKTENPSHLGLLPKPSEMQVVEEYARCKWEPTEPLTRLTLCETIETLPLEFESDNNCKPKRKDRRADDSEEVDTLLIYIFSHSPDGWREDNFFFFLCFGIPEGPRFHTLVVVNGELDGSWADLLSHMADTLPNFEWMRRPDVGRDVCAWRDVLMHELRHRHPVARYRRFVLINASARGPFLPAYFREPWPEAFFSSLSNETK